jgi:hypothetical protein
MHIACTNQLKLLRGYNRRPQDEWLKPTKKYTYHIPRLRFLRYKGKESAFQLAKPPSIS